jgi:hypothetical protein
MMTTQSAGRISIGNSIRQTESNFKRKKGTKLHLKKEKIYSRRHYNTKRKKKSLGRARAINLLLVVYISLKKLKKL